MQPWEGSPCTTSPLGSLCSPGGSETHHAAGVTPRVGTGPAVMTHFWTGCLFSSVLPHRVAAQDPGVGLCPDPGDHPAMPGSLGNPRGSPAPTWSFGRAAGGGGSKSLCVVAAGALLAGLEGPQGYKSPVAAITFSWVPTAKGGGWRCNPWEDFAWATGCGLGCAKPAACHPASIGVWRCASPEMSPCCFAHQPVPIVAKEHLPSGAFIESSGWKGLGCHQWLLLSGQH